MDQKNQTKKLHGFYIALCCCVIAIGVAGFFMQNMEESQSTNALTSVEETDPPDFVSSALTETDDTQNELPVVSSPQPVYSEAAAAAGTEGDIQTQDTAAETNTAQEEYVPTDSYAYDNPDLEPASVVVQAEESGMLNDPVPGMTVLYGYSGNTLMYNEILGDWRTHDGIDIEADIGCSVSAAADGTVISVKKGTYGNTVTIDHGNGLSTVYAQLGEVSVAEGDTVASGDVIGTIGDSIGENTRQAHLHFEVRRDGKPADPEEF